LSIQRTGSTTEGSTSRHSTHEYVCGKVAYVKMEVTDAKLEVTDVKLEVTDVKLEVKDVKLVTGGQRKGQLPDTRRTSTSAGRVREFIDYKTSMTTY